MIDFKTTRKELLGATVAMVALSPLVLQSAEAASVSVNASAVIRQALDVVEATAIDFGSFTAGTAGGTATLNFVDVVSDGPGALRPVGGSVSSGRVTVTGESGANVLVTSGVATFKLDNGGSGAINELTVKDIVYQLGAATGPAISASLPGAINAVDIGAKLVSSGIQNAGTYTGSFTVNVVYP